MHVLTPKLRLPKIHLSAILEALRKIHRVLTENMVLYHILKRKGYRPLKACIAILDLRTHIRKLSRRNLGNDSRNKRTDYYVFLHHSSPL